MARIFGCFGLVLALCCALSAFAHAQHSVILKSKLVSEDGVITLSDLFEVEGEVGAIELARAPAPGERLSLDPGYIRTVAREAGLDWANAAGLLRISVERAARQVTDQEIRDLVAETLYMDTGKVHQISLSSARAVLAAPVDTMGAPVLTSIEHDERTGLFRAEIAAWPEGEPRRVGGRAMPVIDIPVLARTVQRGEVIGADDLEWMSVPSNTIRAQMLTDASGLVGQAARRVLQPGRALRETDFEAPVMIARGETVSLVFQAGTLVLTAQARALENVAEGERARFVNLQSNRTIEAIAIAPGRARVHGSIYSH